MAKQGNETTIYVAFEEHVQFDPARPEKELLRAILVNALSDLKKPGELSRRAREYFLSAEEDYLFSFQSVCNFLNVDPKRILRVAGLTGEPRSKREEIADNQLESMDKVLEELAVE